MNFATKHIQNILSSHKLLEKYNEQKVFHKKAALKNFTIFTGKTPVLKSFFQKKCRASRLQLLLRRDSNTCVYFCKY